MNPETQESRPWYKEPIMWLIVGIPLITVFWGGVMITLATSSKDSLVSDSYYKDGMTYTENLEVDHRAKRLQLKSSLVFTNNEARLHLTGYLDEEPQTLILRLIHPTLKDRDLDVLLQRIDEGTYVGAAEIALPDRRRIWLSSPLQGWRIRTTETIQANQVIQLNAE